MATKIRRSLFIGLGGTGMNTLLYTKKMFIDTYGEIPPMVGFLGIDTDGGVYNKSLPAADGTPVSLTTSEQLPISVNSPAQIYMNDPSRYPWLPECNASSLSALNIGAGQLRSNGRFAVTLKKEEIANRVQSKMQQINAAEIIDNDKYQLLSTSVEVHVVFSLSGGTGCGTFLNIAYLLQQLLPDAKISGYAVLADVFRSMIQGAAVARVRPNAMGALRDIDFLTHLGLNSTPVEIKWAHDVQRVVSRPFSALYLVDNRNANGDIFNNVDQLCEMISLALITSTGELSVAAASVSDNVSKVIADGNMDIKNKKAWAAGFGVSEIVFNGHALSDIYTAKAAVQLVNRMLNGGCDDPSVMANAWIDDTRIRENMGKDDVIDYFMTPKPQFQYTEIDNPENPLAEAKLYLDTRAVDRTEDLNTKLDELKTRVRSSLRDFMRATLNRECGVFLAEKILGSIRTQMDLCNAEMKAEVKNLVDELPRALASLETSCSELADCMGTWFKKGKAQYMEDVCAAVQRVAQLRREIKRREMAREFYNSMNGMLSEVYARIDVIMSNLNAVRDRANDRIESIRQGLGTGGFFQFDLAVSEAPKVTVDNNDISLHDFVEKYMTPLGGVASIADMTTDETAAEINKYTSTLPGCAALAGRSVEQVLSEMPAAELTSLLKRAIAKSMPLFTIDYRGFDAEARAPQINFFVGVENKDRTILKREDVFREMVPGAQSVEYSSIGMKNRILIYRQISVVPAFAVAATKLYEPEYERYEEGRVGTSHWDAQMCARMARERFSLMPANTVERRNIIGMWVMAVLYGLVSYADGQYYIKSKGLGGRPLTGFRVSMGNTRHEAYTFFEDNIDVLKAELDAHIAMLDVPGPDNKIRIINAAAKKAAENGTYLAEMSLCPINPDDILFYPDEAKLIDEELTYILEM